MKFKRSHNQIFQYVVLVEEIMTEYLKDHPEEENRLFCHGYIMGAISVIDFALGKLQEDQQK